MCKRIASRNITAVAAAAANAAATTAIAPNTAVVIQYSAYP